MNQFGDDKRISVDLRCWKRRPYYSLYGVDDTLRAVKGTTVVQYRNFRRYAMTQDCKVPGTVLATTVE